MEKGYWQRLDGNVLLPQASTFSLTLTLYFHEIANKLALALTFGVGFGDI